MKNNEEKYLNLKERYESNHKRSCDRKITTRYENGFVIITDDGSFERKATITQFEIMTKTLETRNTSHKIHLEDLQKWFEEKTVVFGTSTHPQKSLECSLKGTFTVKYKGKVVWTGIQCYSAMEKYNEITS